MTTTRDNTYSAFFTQRLGRVLAASLFAISLAATGCDTVDSNVLDDESGVSVDGNARRVFGDQPIQTFSTTATRHERSGEPIYWIPPDGEEAPRPFRGYKATPSVGWPMSDLIGVWVLITADSRALGEGSSRPQILFWEDGTFTGYAACYSFSGRYRAESDWQLTVSDFHINQKYCVQEQDPIREALVEGLQAATDFRFEHGTLWIMSRGGKCEQVFIFERREENLVSEDIAMPPAARP